MVPQVRAALKGLASTVALGLALLLFDGAKRW